MMLMSPRHKFTTDKLTHRYMRYIPPVGLPPKGLVDNILLACTGCGVDSEVTVDSPDAQVLLQFGACSNDKGALRPFGRCALLRSSQNSTLRPVR